MLTNQNAKQTEKLFQLAKGTFQARIIFDLITRKEASFSDNVGSTKHYSKYITSFTNLYERLRENGVNVKLELGARGGFWTSRIILLD